MINIQTSISFLFTNNKIPEKSKKAIPFKTASKKIPRNKLLQGDLYVKNYETLIKKTEDDSKKTKYIPCSWIRGINIVKMAILLKTIYRFNSTSIKRPRVVFTELE